MRSSFFSILLLSISGCTAVIGADRYHPRGGDADGGTDGGMQTCNPECGPGETCTANVCRCGDGDPCGDGEGCCDGACRALDTLMACGSCTNSCGAVMNANERCEGGECRFDCASGFRDCDGEPGNGCETNIEESENCGDCGIECDDGDVCGGDPPTCIGMCPPGTTECVPESCADTETDLQHCGGCFQPCEAGPFESASCADGACTRTCLPGTADCNAMPGCESSVTRYYPDVDGDGRGSAGGPTIDGCPGAPPPGYTTDQNDCNDSDPFVYSGAPETCDGVDQNCNGLADDGVPPLTCSCGPGSVPGFEECVGGATICRYPPESCNGFDEDCDGAIDEGGACGGGPRSCRDVPPTSGDGIYTVDPDGPAPRWGPISVYCDMRTAGGGWTLVYKIRNDFAQMPPWWDGVNPGTGTVFPVGLGRPGGFFDGPTMATRADYAATVGAFEYRATLRRDSTGEVMFDVRTTYMGATGRGLRCFATGCSTEPDFSGQSCSSTPDAFVMTTTIGGSVPAGGAGYLCDVGWPTCMGCVDWIEVGATPGISSSGRFVGDDSIGIIDTTTSFWVR